MCGKECFRKRDAELALKKVKKSSKNYRKECRTYYCETCNSWHLTSKEEWVDQEELDVLEKERWEKLLKNNHYE